MFFFFCLFLTWRTRAKRTVLSKDKLLKDSFLSRTNHSLLKSKFREETRGCVVKSVISLSFIIKTLQLLHFCCPRFYTLKRLQSNKENKKTKQELALRLLFCLIISWITSTADLWDHKKTILCNWNMSLTLSSWFSELLPVLSKVKMSPSHLAALLGVLGSELQLERRRLFRFGETCSSGAESISIKRGRYFKTSIPIMIHKKKTLF